MRKLRYLLILTLGITLILSSCGKDESAPKPVTPVVTPPGGGIPFPSSPFFFSGNINGNNVLYESNKNSVFNGALSGPGSGGSSSLAIFQSSGTNFQKINLLTSAMTPLIDVLRIKDFLSPNGPGPEDIYEMFLPGNYIYDTNPGNNLVNGIHVAWFDSSGNQWTTDNGSGDQTGSSFTITERGPYNGDFTLFTFKATFSCKLYDDLGNMIEVQNATVSGQVAPFQ